MPSPTFLGAGTVRGNSTFAPITVTAGDLPAAYYSGGTLVTVATAFYRRYKTTGAFDAPSFTGGGFTVTPTGTAGTSLPARTIMQAQTWASPAESIEDWWAFQVWVHNATTYGSWTSVAFQPTAFGGVTFTPTTAGGETPAFAVQQFALSYDSTPLVNDSAYGTGFGYDDPLLSGWTDNVPVSGLSAPRWGIRPVGSATSTWTGAAFEVVVIPRPGRDTPGQTPVTPGGPLLRPFVQRHRTAGGTHRGPLGISEHPNLPFATLYALSPPAGLSYPSVAAYPADWDNPAAASPVPLSRTTAPSPLAFLSTWDVSFGMLWTQAGDFTSAPPPPGGGGGGGGGGTGWGLGFLISS